MPKKLDIKLFLAVGLMLTGFLVCIVTFTRVYRSYFWSAYPEGQTIVDDSAKTQKVHFIAVGDIMLSRSVAAHAEKAGDVNWMWAHIRDFLDSADFVFGNLEGPTNGTEVYSDEKTLVFNALPKLIKTLPSVGILIVNLANNHIMDQGEAGLTTTQTLLHTIGMAQTGTSETQENPWQPRIIEKNGFKIAFIGATYAAYNDNGTGVNSRVARVQDLEKLRTSVTQAKKIADFVVVTMHAGIEYTRKPITLQTDFAHTAIDAGADIVIGAHPHWVQSIETYRGKYIFYSLGNFVFDQEFSQETDSGLALDIFLVKRDTRTFLQKIDLVPIMIENYGQPRTATPVENAAILQTIGQSSSLLK